MTNTKQIKTALPCYTASEEFYNTLSHGAGVLIGFMILIACLNRAFLSSHPSAVFSGALFGISMIVTYAVSSVYHGLRAESAKRVLRVVDHCAIYFLIAGTYTPILLCKLADSYPINAYATLAAVWGLAILAAVLTAVDMHRFRHFSMVCYVGIGWSVIFSIVQVYEVLTPSGFSLLLSGGIAYTVGALIYNLGKRKNTRYMHSIFHLFTLLGSLLQGLCIIFFVL